MTFSAYPVAVAVGLIASAHGPAVAQVCDNVVLEDQAQVNAFSCETTTFSLQVMQAPGTSDPIVDLSPLSVLTSVGTAFIISGNTALESLAGLENLASVGSGLRIHENAALISLAGLNNISSVGLSLIIEYNEALATLDGLESLTSIGGQLLIWYNDALNSVNGLQNLSSVQGDLYITSNRALHDCASGLVGLVSDGEYVGVGGNVAIANNAFGGVCNSPEQVLGVLTRVEQSDVAGLPAAFGLFQNYPNPFNSTTRIDFELARAGQATLAVYDVLGKEVVLLASGEFAAGRYRAMWDASGLPNGIYVYRLKAGSFTAVKTLVLLK